MAPNADNILQTMFTADQCDSLENDCDFILKYFNFNVAIFQSVLNSNFVEANANSILQATANEAGATDFIIQIVSPLP